MKKAIALRYDSSVPAPFITGTASGGIVKKLLIIAEKYGIPVVQDNILAETLFLLKPGDFIPEDVYEIVAEIFIFIRNLQEI